MTDNPYKESVLGAQVHQRIREQLQKKGADEEALIEALVWSKQRYQMMFVGPSGPSVKTLVKVATAIGCEVMKLIANVGGRHG